MTLPDRVTLVEVGPRDGLQNEPGTVPTATKIEFVDRLARTGLTVVETTSFVSPRHVPQLADAADVMAGIDRVAGVRYPVLVPNERGLDDALGVGADEVAVFTAATDAFTERNIGTTVDGSFEMMRPVADRARAAGMRLRGYVSVALGCPFQGDVPVDDVVAVVVRLFDLGCDEVSLGDTIGVGTAGAVHRLIGRVASEADLGRIAVHFHDTYGQGLANTLAAFEAGVAIADTSAGGLGGCPFAPGASGNLATEDLVYALHGSGVDTGVDLDALVDVTAWMAGHLGRPPRSRAVEAILAKRAHPGPGT